MLLIRGLLRVVIQVVVFGAILLLPIGTWDWPRAIQFLIAFGVISLASTVALAVLAPASLEARVNRSATKDQPRADKVATLFLAIVHIAWFVLIPNDVFRWQVFPEPSVVVAALGAVLCLLGYGIMLTSVWQNAYATPIVGDQEGRDQTLVDTGLYARVRHPMYLGHLFFCLGLPLWLGSFLGAVVIPIVFAPIVARILIEERTLVKKLPGYAEYRERVPHRLIPLVW
jgi:protein-S-isoprenylcysteine O-methyltransferase Ste14